MKKQETEQPSTGMREKPLYFHHTALAKGYVPRYGTSVEAYNGIYGRGAIVHKANADHPTKSKRYHWVEYWLENEMTDNNTKSNDMETQEKTTTKTGDNMKTQEKTTPPNYCSIQEVATWCDRGPRTVSNTAARIGVQSHGALTYSDAARLVRACRPTPATKAIQTPRPEQITQEGDALRYTSPTGRKTYIRANPPREIVQWLGTPAGRRAAYRWITAEQRGCDYNRAVLYTDTITDAATLTGLNADEITARIGADEYTATAAARWCGTILNPADRITLRPYACLTADDYAAGLALMKLDPAQDCKDAQNLRLVWDTYKQPPAAAIWWVMVLNSRGVTIGGLSAATGVPEIDIYRAIVANRPYMRRYIDLIRMYIDEKSAVPSIDIAAIAAIVDGIGHDYTPAVRVYDLMFNNLYL